MFDDIDAELAYVHMPFSMCVIQLMKAVREEIKQACLLETKQCYGVISSHPLSSF